MAVPDDFREMFFVECGELLESLANGLREMEEPGYDKETVHAVFRAAHSIKGGAAAFALTALVTFAHRFETALDQIRSDRLLPDARVMAVMHRCSDCLADLVGAARQEDEPNTAQMTALLDELDRLSGEDKTGFGFVPLALDLSPPVPASGLVIRFAPQPDLYLSGNDPLALIHALRRLGPAEVALDASAVPLLEDWTADECHLRWTVTLTGNIAPEVIATVFEFVEDCCEIGISPLSADSLPAAEEPASFTPVPILLAVESAGDPADETAIAEPASGPGPQAARAVAAEAGATIRVNLDRVDRLMNMIGELVIKEAMLSQVIDTVGLSDNLDVAAGLDGIRQLADEIQDSVMAIRAQPLKLVFQRMHRILREASEATAKPARLITLGEQTEVDKTMIERLVDPLTHMIRNSVDHGLEDEVTRQRRGKPAQGTVTLSAAHRSGRVQIEVSDDGGGIDRGRVREIAESRGLIAPGTVLTPTEIDQLLFLPGFSSKQEVSAISGRGVGLDVVRREIMALGGRIMIHSVEGQGSTFSIALPLTLAVLEGMLIQLCDQTMVLPITSVQETLRPAPSALHGIGQAGRVVANRGDLIPIIDLGCIFGLRDQRASLDDGVLIVVETDSQRRAALHVDGIVDQRQVVIKSLEENYGRVAGVSAATILGDGKIALIIDPEEIVLSCAGDAGLVPRVLSANG